jgi:hypothetical protein
MVGELMDTSQYAELLRSFSFSFALISLCAIDVCFSSFRDQYVFCACAFVL